MDSKYEQLFEPFTFKSGVTLDNRLLMAPMTTSASFENGMFTTDEHMYYEHRGGGVGAIITACAHVQENGKFSSSPSAATDDRVESLTKLAKTIQSTGSKAILQIFHVGRMGSRRSLRGERPVSASGVPALREDAEIPRELTDAEIEELVHSFGEATRRAIEAGFDGIELHGANTYLIQQFFSPHSNVRTDYWGGSLEKRMNFPIEVVNAAKQTIDKYVKKPFIFGYRVSPEEIEEPGITIQDTISLLEELKIYDLDYFHISLGNIFESSLRQEVDKEPILKKIQKAVGEDVPLIGVGNVITPQDAVDAMDELAIPLIALGRELIIEPNWVDKVKAGKEDSLRKVIDTDDREDLLIPDAMWEYIRSRPGWLPIVD